MKYILLPITIVLWYLTSYYGIYITVIGTVFIFSLSWLWWIIAYFFLMAALFWISISLPSLLRFLILKFYGINWFSCIVHSLAGLIGLIQIIRLYIANPPELVIGDESFFILKGMWELAPIKTLIIVPPFMGFVVSLVWSNVIAPVYIKLYGVSDSEEMDDISMDYNELITDLQDIPRDRNAIIDNLELLIRHATYLSQRNNITDTRAKDILDVAPLFIRKQLNRLRMHIDDEVDIIAWISRNLMELLFMLRYMYRGTDQYDELIKEQLKDLKDIEDKICPNESTSGHKPEVVKSFITDIQKLWEEMQKFGIEREKLNRPCPARHFAEGAGLLKDYQSGWWIHSKYVHPSAHLLFGKREFAYGDGARLYFWVLAQYYAARNLRDLYMMIKAIPNR